MSSSCNSVIGALKDSLGKPDLDPRARAVLEQRLEYWLDKKRERRWPDKALKASAKSRRESARRKHQEVLPLIRKLQDDGLIYKEIAAELQRRGFKSGKGMPYSETWIGNIIREAAAEEAISLLAGGLAVSN